jgi:class 3 adenylate cyclase
MQQHHGRVVGSPEDNLLAEFASVVEAVRCAVAIQAALKTLQTQTWLRTVAWGFASASTSVM